MPASMLVHNGPSLVIGRLVSPLREPNANEREGYLPNVFSRCGTLIHDKDLVIPYAMSDEASTFATVIVAELLGRW